MTERSYEMLISLTAEIDNLRKDITEIKKSGIKGEYSNIDDKEELVLRFKGKDKLNSSMAARIIGITQTELFKVVKKGRLRSVGETKRIFLTEEVIRYLKKDNVLPHKMSVRKNRDSNKFHEVISDKEMKELYAEQQAV